MVRGGNVKSEGDDSSQSEPKTSKRRCVQSACVPCRKRKSKCDGGTPNCATCTAVYKTPCHYDEQSESRRTKVAPSTSQKRDNSSIVDSGDNAEFLVHSIRNLPDAEAYELIQHIRKDPILDIASLADTWKKTVTLPIHSSSEHASLEHDLSLLIGKPSVTKTGQSRHFGHSSSLGLVPEDEDYTRAQIGPGQALENRRNGTWTTVTDDIGFVERLLDLYFRWSHPFYVAFSRECFYKDFRSGRQKYCSPLLVNAILAYACHFTDDPAGRSDPDNFRTAGDYFFAEARRLLYEDETPSLLTTQALCVMSIREPSAGRDSSGFMYIGRCMRMAVELGLHLKDTSPDLTLTPSEVEVRKVTFWGCFTLETVWSLCVGRISQLPQAAITVDKPILEEDFYSQVTPGMVTSRAFLQEFSTLSELINDNNFMYFAPKERFTSRRLLDMYNKYQLWYKSLPSSLSLPTDGGQPPPHIIVLHMLYYTVLVHLFRPMLKVDLIHSDLRPRDICIDSANMVTDLLRLYRRYYDMRACHLIITHILLSVSIVHLLYSPDNPTSAANLVDSLQGLEDLSVCHYFGARSFKIVHALAKTWNIPWPEALNLSKLLPRDDGTLESPALDSMFNSKQTPVAAHDLQANNYGPPLPQPGIPTRRESLSMFAPNPDMAATSQESNFPHRPAMLQTDGLNHATLGYANTSASPTAALHQHHHHHHQPQQQQQPQQQPQQQQQQQQNPATEAAEHLFWTPIPGIGVPIIPRTYQMSPMDLNNMLGTAGADEWNRFSRDGFKISDAWVPDPMAGFHNGGAGATVTTDHLHQAQQQQQQQGLSGTSHDGTAGQGYDWWGGAGAGGQG